MARKTFPVTDAMRDRVRRLAGVGVPQDDIANIIGCDAKTLRKHLRAELDRGAAEATAAVASYLFANAKGGNVAAQIFWLKRARWGASGMSWALASVAAPAHRTASLGSIQNFGGYLGGALAPTVTGFIVQATGTFVPALLVGAVIALAYLVVIPNRPIRSAELGVAAPSARPSGA